VNVSEGQGGELESVHFGSRNTRGRDTHGEWKVERAGVGGEIEKEVRQGKEKQGWSS